MIAKTRILPSDFIVENKKRLRNFSKRNIRIGELK